MRASTAIAILCFAAEVALSVALPLPASKSFDFVNVNQQIEQTHPGGPTQPEHVPTSLRFVNHNTETEDTRTAGLRWGPMVAPAESPVPVGSSTFLPPKRKNYKNDVFVSHDSRYRADPAADPRRNGGKGRRPKGVTLPKIGSILKRPAPTSLELPPLKKKKNRPDPYPQPQAIPAEGPLNSMPPPAVHTPAEYPINPLMDTRPQGQPLFTTKKPLQLPPAGAHQPNLISASSSPPGPPLPSSLQPPPTGHTSDVAVHTTPVLTPRPPPDSPPPSTPELPHAPTTPSIVERELREHVGHRIKLAARAYVRELFKVSMDDLDLD